MGDSVDWFHIVRHRIDGLEKTVRGLHASRVVRHRIDGLEIDKFVECKQCLVRHRIDGLEKIPNLTQ